MTGSPSIIKVTNGFMWQRLLQLVKTTTWKSVAAMNWTGEHRAFIVETFIKTNDSVTATQGAFRLHFNLGRHDPVPARNTILLWVTNFRATGSALKRKSTSRPRTARTPET
ncbi:uncharacterized protein LOC118766599 [Octopus sinensis]|uniref:Uncharacterized protein LOC118766599 n=1 Tax=Octopus sinensis TaxID=2607531 RepID=A0A7E6FE89_9MOLL|nr:uncharacterized protein LOC118766599 [Octopus sinensis]